MDGEAELTRRTRFAARHAYADVDGAPPGGPPAELHRPHGHLFTLDVTVRGPYDDRGFVTDLEALDGAIEALVAPLRDGLLNRTVDAFRDGALQPSTEALARWAWERLASAVPPPARLTAVRVAEDDALWAVYRGP